MGNDTTPESEIDPAQKIWVLVTVKICEITNVLILISVFWIGVNMVAFANHHKRWNRKTRKGKIYAFCFATIVISFLAVAMDVTGFFLSRTENLCELFIDIKTVLIGLSLSSVHFFLWIRQYLVYQDKLMKNITPRVIHIVSYIMIVLIATTQPAISVLLVYEKRYYAGPYGCYIMLLQSRHGLLDFKGSIFLIAGIMTMEQIVSLMLFLYPLLRLLRLRKMNPSSRGSNTSALVTKVKRYCACAAIAVVSDMAAAQAVNQEYSPNLYMYSSAIINVDILMNLIAILVTYDECVKIMSAVIHFAPICCKNNNVVAPIT